jgi:hypothetical protein
MVLRQIGHKLCMLFTSLTCRPKKMSGNFSLAKKIFWLEWSETDSLDWLIQTWFTFNFNFNSISISIRIEHNRISASYTRSLGRHHPSPVNFGGRNEGAGQSTTDFLRVWFETSHCWFLVENIGFCSLSILIKLYCQLRTVSPCARTSQIPSTLMSTGAAISCYAAVPPSVKFTCPYLGICREVSAMTFSWKLIGPSSRSRISNKINNYKFLSTKMSYVVSLSIPQVLNHRDAYFHPGCWLMYITNTCETTMPKNRLTGGNKILCHLTILPGF